MRVIIKKLYFVLLVFVIAYSAPLFSQCIVLQDGLQKESINNFVRRNERFKQKYLYVPVYHESKFETKPSHKQKYFPIIKKRKAAVSFLKHNGYDLDKGGSSTILPWMRTKIYYLQSQGGIYLQQDFCAGQYQHVRNESCPFLGTEACLYKYNCNSSNWQISNSTIGAPKPSQIGLNITENTSLRRFFNNKMVCNAFGEKSLIINFGTFYKNYNIKEVSDTLHRYMYLNQEKEVYSINAYLYNIEDNYFEVDVVLEKVKVSKDNVYSHKRKKKVRLKFVYNCAKEIWELEEK